MNRPLFEVRMPTYNRPDLLRRAIKSLLRQTYPHWTAVVFDDSTCDDARDIVQSTGDDRITYKKNQVQMGAAGNIDQCFSPQSMLSGNYGCLLEDDNYWLPDFLAEVSRSLSREGPEIILVNQRVYDERSGLQGPEVTTRGDWFFGGMVSPLYLRATLLLMEGISNGGLVWRLEREVDLRVGPTVGEAGIQEACRSLLVTTPFLFISQALAVWTFLPQSESARADETYRSFGRGMQCIRSFVLRSHGRTVVEAAKPIARKRGLDSRLVETICYSGYPHLAGDLVRGRASEACRGVAKGLAIRLVQESPCEEFIGLLARPSIENSRRFGSS